MNKPFPSADQVHPEIQSINGHQTSNCAYGVASHFGFDMCIHVDWFSLIQFHIKIKDEHSVEIHFTSRVIFIYVHLHERHGSSYSMLCSLSITLFVSMYVEYITNNTN